MHAVADILDVILTKVSPLFHSEDDIISLRAQIADLRTADAVTDAPVTDGE